MYVIDITNAPAKGLRVPGMSEKYREDGLNFPDSGGALQVDARTGAALIDHCPGVQEHTPDPDGSGSGNGDGDTE